MFVTVRAVPPLKNWSALKGATALLLPVSIWYLGVTVQVAFAQQTPPTQKPEAHSLAPPQVCPFVLSSRAPACTQPHSAATAGAFADHEIGRHERDDAGWRGRPAEPGQRRLLGIGQR